MNPATSDDGPLGRLPVTIVGKSHPSVLALDEVNGAIIITVELEDLKLWVEPERVHHFRDLVNQAANRATAAKEKPQRDRDDLRKMLSHIEYELGILKWSATKVRPLTDGMAAEEQYASIAALESLLVHARNLYEFFYADKKTQTSDALATEFFNEADTWINERSKRKSLPKVNGQPMIRAINKHLAHITWDRVDDDFPPVWPVAEILTSLEDVADLFRHLALRAYRP